MTAADYEHDLTDDEALFAAQLGALRVPLLVAEPSTKTEFVMPKQWSGMTARGNDARMQNWDNGKALLAVAGPISVFDIDPRNDGDEDAVRQLLEGLAVRVYAEVRTPGGGWHLYCAGTDDMRPLHSPKDWPGLDVQAHGSLIYLPGTRRPKYDGRGYRIIRNDLAELIDNGDANGDGARIVEWATARRKAAATNLPPAPVWDGREHEGRERKYLEALVTNSTDRAADAPQGSRNVEIYNAALCLGNYVAGAGLPYDVAYAALMGAANRNGLLGEDGTHAVDNTIRSGLSKGQTNPRGVPDRPLTPQNSRPTLTVVGDDDVPPDPYDDVPQPEDTEEDITENLWSDVAALLAGGMPDPPTPDVCKRADGVGLFYREQTNVLFGDPESGKTWIAYCAATEELNAGGRVLIIDADHNGMSAVVERLVNLGANAAYLADTTRFRLFEPEDGQYLLAGIRLVTKDQVNPWRPTLAVVDSIGEVLPMLGLSSNVPDDYTKGHADVLKPLAVAGAAVIGIDHLAKSEESRKQGATGTFAKKRAVSGTMIRVTRKEPFARGREGSAVLTIAKDRPGGLRGATPTVAGTPEDHCGTFTLGPTGKGEELAWKVAVPDGMSDNFRPTGLMERISVFLESCSDPQTKRAIRSNVQGKQDAKDLALRVLIDEGHVTTTQRGAATMHALIRPYARDDRPAFWGTGHGPDNDDEMSEMSGARSAG